ncbi:hypothetical protein QZH41_005267 [Actinostola sp. cb2023]|nr:hypothetical protein QZH41_005267 [Actinostola sp. cb2023]
MYEPFERLSDRQIRKARLHKVRIDKAQLDHFLQFTSRPYFYQDVAYGSRTIKLDSGEEFSMPNVVRTVARCTIIPQYLEFCMETEFEPVSRSTMWRVLEVQEGSQRKSLQGLDNTAADGADGYEALLKIVDNLEEVGSSTEWCSLTRKKLHAGKLYLTTNYRAHCQDDSNQCPDHCRPFALSDPEDSDYKTVCDHTHDLACTDCESLADAVQDVQPEIRNNSSRLVIPVGEQDGSTEEYAQIADEEQLRETSEAVLAVIGITHPVMYNVYDLCTMKAEQKLASFKVKMLREICSYFELPYNYKDTKSVLIDLVPPTIKILKKTNTTLTLARTREPSKPNQVPTSTIVGVGLGSGVLVLMVLMSLIYAFVKKRNKSIHDRIHSPCDHWEIVSIHVELIEELGKGAFGKVWKASMERKVVDGKTKPVAEAKQNTMKDSQAILMKNEKDIMTVAVKMLDSDATLEEKSEFLREIEFMKNVGCHRNIISMVACCTKEEQAFLVVEFAKHVLKESTSPTKAMKEVLGYNNPYQSTSMQEGLLKEDEIIKEYVSLKHKQGHDNLTLEKCGFFISKSCGFLGASPDGVVNDPSVEDENGLAELKFFEASKIAVAKIRRASVVAGLLFLYKEYLAFKRIVHRDLAARNVLVADENLVKIADFGLSRHVTYKDQIYQAEGRRKLPIKWMSPEAIFDQTFTTKSDVYQIMTSCWQGHAHDRPSFTDVIQSLERLMTRDKPYVEFTGFNEDNQCYLVPSFNSVPESEGSGDETTTL